MESGQKRNFLTYWIPKKLWVNRDIDYRYYKNAKVLVSFLLVGILTFGAYAVLNFRLDLNHSFILCMIALVAQSSLLLYYKVFAGYRVAVYGLILSLLGIIFYHQLYSEPFLVSHLIWAPVFPMLAAMLLGIRPALIITILTLVTFLGTSLYVEHYGAIELLRMNNPTLNIASVILSSSVMFCLVYCYDRSKYEVFSLLEKKNNELERISEDNRLLTAIVTHDLSNPLTTMGIYADKVRRILKTDLGEDHEVYQKCAARLDSFASSHHASLELIHNVKNTLALQMKKIEISLQETDLYEALKHVVADYQRLAKAKRIDIRINRLCQESLTCLAEPISLRSSVISNLISNAIKFSEEGAVIDLNLNKTGDRIVFEVRDYGVGIPPDKVQTLFELKHSHSGIGTYGELGTGYGMPIVKSFVEKFRGEIKVDSKTQEVCRSGSDHSGTSVVVSLLSA